MEFSTEKHRLKIIKPSEKNSRDLFISKIWSSVKLKGNVFAATKGYLMVEYIQKSGHISVQIDGKMIWNLKPATKKCYCVIDEKKLLQKPECSYCLSQIFFLGEQKRRERGFKWLPRMIHWTCPVQVSFVVYQKICV